MSPELLNQLKQLQRPNMAWCAAIAALLLTAIGVAAIGTVEPHYSAVQGQKWFPIALILMVLCLLPPPRRIGLATYPMMWLIFAALIYVLLDGAPLVHRLHGATSWIDVPGMGRLQPSELAKVVFVLALARYLRYRRSYRRLRGLLVPFLIMFLPVTLILQQPDLGTALVFAPALFAMLVAAGAKLRHIGGLLGLGAAAMAVVVAICLWAPASMQVLKDHQQERIVTMIGLISGDTRHLQKGAYHQNVARRLIAAGGLTGYGGERSRDVVRHNELPHHHNDSIFAVIVNRWGLIGAWITLALYLALIASILAVAARSKDPFARLACVGFSTVIFTQVTINIGAHVGLLPFTGITLPFVSYGGSSLLAKFAMIGLTANFASRRPAMISWPSFEFEQRDRQRAKRRRRQATRQILSGYEHPRVRP